jgi:hypothetical protein
MVAYRSTTSVLYHIPVCLCIILRTIHSLLLSTSPRAEIAFLNLYCVSAELREESLKIGWSPVARETQCRTDIVVQSTK